MAFPTIAICVSLLRCSCLKDVLVLWKPTQLHNFQNSLISKPVASKNPQRLVKVRCGMYNIGKSNCNCLSVDVWVAKQL